MTNTTEAILSLSLFSLLSFSLLFIILILYQSTVSQNDFFLISQQNCLNRVPSGSFLLLIGVIYEDFFKTKILKIDENKLRLQRIYDDFCKVCYLPHKSASKNGRAWMVTEVNERFWGVTLDLSTIYLSIYLSTHRPILMFHYFIFFCLYVILFVTWGRRVQWWVSRCRVSASGPCAGRGRTRSRCLAPLLKYKRILTILEPASSGAFLKIYIYIYIFLIQES